MSRLDAGAVLVLGAERERRVAVAEPDERRCPRLADRALVLGARVLADVVGSRIGLPFPVVALRLLLRGVPVLVLEARPRAPDLPIVHGGPVPPPIGLALSR